DADAPRLVANEQLGRFPGRASEPFERGMGEVAQRELTGRPRRQPQQARSEAAAPSALERQEPVGLERLDEAVGRGAREARRGNDLGEASGAALDRVEDQHRASRSSVAWARSRSGSSPVAPAANRSRRGPRRQPRPPWNVRNPWASSALTRRWVVERVKPVAATISVKLRAPPSTASRISTERSSTPTFVVACRAIVMFRITIHSSEYWNSPSILPDRGTRARSAPRCR